MDWNIIVPIPSWWSRCWLGYVMWTGLLQRLPSCWSRCWLGYVMWTGLLQRLPSWWSRCWSSAAGGATSELDGSCWTGALPPAIPASAGEDPSAVTGRDEIFNRSWLEWPDFGTSRSDIPIYELFWVRYTGLHKHKGKDVQNG